MQLNVPDPEYTGSRRARANFVLAVKLAFGFLAVMWSVYLFDQFMGLDLIRFGLLPRDTRGLLGVATTPLLHFNFSHIVSNTLPLMIGGTFMLYLYPNSSLRVLPVIYAGSALAAWVFARDSVHIGASGLVYGILTYVFFAGILRRDLRSIGASLAVWFLYGSMIWGVFPDGSNRSWELHLSGAVLGTAGAWWFRDRDLPPYKRYSWELEDEVTHEPDASRDAPPWRQWPD